MRASEILRNLANIVDAAETKAAAQPPAPEAEPTRAPVSLPASEPGEPELDVMVPPLQQKIELLKKATGVPSAYDHFDDEEPQDDIEQLKKSAGIAPVVIQTAAEDNDVLD